MEQTGEANAGFVAGSNDTRVTSTLNRAMSLAESSAISLAGKMRPSARRTSTRSARSIACHAVAMTFGRRAIPLASGATSGGSPAPPRPRPGQCGRTETTELTVSGGIALAAPEPMKLRASANRKRDSFQRCRRSAGPDIVCCRTAEAGQFDVSSRTALPDPRSAEENANDPRTKLAAAAITTTPARPAQIAFISQSPIAVAVFRKSIKSRRSSGAAICCIGILDPGI